MRALRSKRRPVRCTLGYCKFPAYWRSPLSTPRQLLCWPTIRGCPTYAGFYRKAYRSESKVLRAVFRKVTLSLGPRCVSCAESPGGLGCRAQQRRILVENQLHGYLGQQFLEFFLFTKGAQKRPVFHLG